MSETAQAEWQPKTGDRVTVNGEPATIVGGDSMGSLLVSYDNKARHTALRYAVDRSAAVPMQSPKPDAVIKGPTAAPATNPQTPAADDLKPADKPVEPAQPDPGDAHE